MQPHYFIAIPVADEALKDFAETLLLDRHYKTVYELEEYHLTLRFLGALAAEEHTAWRQRLEAITQHVSPFTLQLDHLERFGSVERPRVFAAGPRYEEKLFQLAHQLNPESSKPFVPHVTLAKKWNPEVTYLPPEHMPAVAVPVKEIVLYRIYPAERPRYQADARFQLRKKQ